MIRVGFNATPLLSPFTGIGQYTYHLAKALQSHSTLHMDLFYGLNWKRMGWSTEVREVPVPGLALTKSVVKKIIPNIYILNRQLQQLKFDYGVKANQLNLYHEPNFLAFHCRLPTVITVHDLSWIRFPETHPKQRVKAMERYFETGLRKAAMIITDSEFVKKELGDVFNIAPSRIQSVPLGVESLFQPRTEIEICSLLQAYRLNHKKYLLTVATREPRKNLKTALAAYQQLPQTIRKNYPFVIVGMKGWNNIAFEKQIAPMVKKGEILQLDYLPRADLAKITAGALLMVYPSIYEGFGLPPLEAMACGVPTIVSNVSSLPEVVGDAGLQANPCDADHIAECMQRLIMDQEFHARLAQKSLLRSKLFTWENCAKQTLDVYHLAASL